MYNDENNNVNIFWNLATTTRQVGKAKLCELALRACLRGALESAIMAKSVLFCQCQIFKSQDSDFDALCTPQELKKIKAIRAATTVPWTLENSEHILYFLKIYKTVFAASSEAMAIDLSVADRDDLEHMMAKLDYRKLGFQNKDPSTDVRGAKLLGVKHLYNFTTTHNDELVEMLKLYPTFPISACSLNITYTLVWHLHLNHGTDNVFVSPYGGLEQPSFQIKAGQRRSDYIAFLSLLPFFDDEEPEKILTVLHAYALISVIRRWKASWKQMRRVSGMTTEEYYLMNFNREILPSAWRHVEHLLLQRPHTMAEMDFNHRQVYP